MYLVSKCKLTSSVFWTWWYMTNAVKNTLKLRPIEIEKMTVVSQNFLNFRGKNVILQKSGQLVNT